MAKESAKVAKNAASSEGGITLENMTEKFQAKGSGQNPFYSVDLHCREEERQESMALGLVWLPTGRRHQQRQKRGNTTWTTMKHIQGTSPTDLNLYHTM